MRNASNREKVAGGRRTGGRRPARRLPHWPLLAAAVAMYLGASLLLVGTQSHPFRPLFEGVGPPPAYRWVKPPGPFAGNNVPPHPSEQDIRLGTSGSPQFTAVSGDSQLVLNLPAGAIPAAAGASAGSISVKPLAPDRLGGMPAGLFPDGNAYLVQIAYQPAGTPLANLAAAGDAVLTAPAPAVTLLFSPDGTAWQRLQTSQIPGGTTVAAAFRQPGYFLAGSTVNVVGTAGPAGRHTSVVILGIFIAGAAAVLVLAPVVYIRSRGRDGT